MNLTLAAWEGAQLSPDACKTPFQTLKTEVWRGAGENWLWCQTELAGCGEVLIVRRQNDDENWNFVVGVERGTILNSRSPDLADAVRLALEQRRIGRIFYLNDEGKIELQNPQWLLFLGVGGSGSWTPLKHENGKWDGAFPTPFRWADKTRHDETAILAALQKPATTWLDWSREELKNPDSPLGFARAWAGLEWEEQKARLSGLTAENEREYRTGVRRVLWAQRELWAQNEPVEWYLNPNGGVNLYVFDETEDFQTPPRVENWAKLLFQSYVRALTPEQIVAHVVLKEAQAYQDHILEFETDPPTAHEQLEAHLELREWIQTHFPDENPADYFD